MTMNPLLLTMLCLSLSVIPQVAAGKTALLIAGKPSHARGEHEFVDNSTLLAETINSANLGLQALVVEGFPSTQQLATADTLFIFSDGLKNHVARDHLEALQAHVAEGRGLGIIHFALEPADAAMAEFFDGVLGGHFVVNHSVNPIWTLEQPILLPHPITNGVALADVEDEWYYHIRFVAAVEPILQGHPPADSLADTDGPRSGNPSVRAALAANEPQTLAWVRTAESGTRAFAFTGGHWHFNFGDEHYRRLFLNAILWTAGLEVPPAGVSFDAIPVPRYDYIDIAIARRDLADVYRHIHANPASLNKGRSPSQPPLHVSIMRQQDEITQVLIAEGADLDLQDGSGRSPLHIAVLRDQPQTIALLLEKGADPHQHCNVGWTPLHHAAAQNKEAAVEKLLSGGAEATQLSQLGGTPLHEAAATGSLAIAKMLLEAGADPRVVSKTGMTALDVAIEFNNQDVLPILRSLTELQ
jgi:type 1 glutamine amidotransferase